MDVHVKLLLKHIADMSETDVIINCKGGSVNAHSFMLKVRSEVFKKALNGRYKESRTSVINLKEFVVIAVEALVKYINSGAVSELSEMNTLVLFHFYQLADMYLFDELKTVIGKTLTNRAGSLPQAFEILNIIDCNSEFEKIAISKISSEIRSSYGNLLNFELNVIPQAVKLRIFDQLMKDKGIKCTV